jgi:hypothetical protein
MVKYYGRAKTITGSINTNQSGLNMSGAVSSVGHAYSVQRYINRRVDSLAGVCGIPKQNGGSWRQSLKNKHPYCKPGASKCLAAAGSVGRKYNSYYKTPKSGEKGCGAGGGDDPFRKYSIEDKLEYLRTYFKKIYPDHTLCLMGEDETIKNKLYGISCEGNYKTADKDFINLAWSSGNQNSDIKARNCINDLNEYAKILGPLAVSDDDEHVGEYFKLGLFTTTIKCCLSKQNYGQYQYLDERVKIYSLNIRKNTLLSLKTPCSVWPTVPETSFTFNFVYDDGSSGTDDILRQPATDMGPRSGSGVYKNSGYTNNDHYVYDGPCSEWETQQREYKHIAKWGWYCWFEHHGIVGGYWHFAFLSQRPCGDWNSYTGGCSRRPVDSNIFDWFPTQPTPPWVISQIYIKCAVSTSPATRGRVSPGPWDLGNFPTLGTDGEYRQDEWQWGGDNTWKGQEGHKIVPSYVLPTYTPLLLDATLIPPRR